MAHAPESRKTVTVVFTDVTGWTSLGEGMDPESLRHVMSRYFDEMRGAIERHGGRVEKFIGDAVMAVFGIPVLHEDDAVRAVRAAAEMRDVLQRLNEELERGHGVRIRIRTGVNTGEVVVSADLDQSLATGEPVTIAARLEQAAAPDEILLGAPTYALVKDAVEAEEAGALDLKGKTHPVPAWRLVSVRSETPGVARRLGSPLVGRARELERLHEALARSVDDQRCLAVSLVADAGVGKTRLAAEFLNRVGDDVTVGQGRCLPYGESVTFWPVADVVRQLSGIEPDDPAPDASAKVAATLGADPDAPGITDHLAAVLGLTDVAFPVQETFWAIRRFLEAVARTRPLVVVFDDIHWGETTFLDLVEYLLGWGTGPILLLCSTRPELLELRPGFRGGNPQALSIVLAPLTDAETHLVLEQLADGDELDGAVQAHISEAAEGNALFVEEIFRMLVDEGLLVRAGDRWAATGDVNASSIPPTVHTLLDARLEVIPPDERIVLQRASVMGRAFSWAAVAELSPKGERPDVGAHLQSLVRRAMIIPDRRGLRGEDGFAFSHVLVRDAAYRSVAKGTRAALHRRFARWLMATVDDAADQYDEVIGYHLEQSVECRKALGPLNDRDRKLAQEAARHLADAGHRAFERNDLPATIGLLSRALSLLDDDDPLSLEIAPDLGTALAERGEPRRASEVFADAAARCAVHGDARLAAHITLQRWFATDDVDISHLTQEAQSALEVFAAADDDRGMSRAYRALGDVVYAAGRVGARDAMMEQALGFARRAGDAREVGEIQHAISVDLNLGPTHAVEGIRRCEQMLAEGDGSRATTGSLFHALAHLRAMRGEFEEAFALAEKFRGILKDDGAMASYWFFAEVPYSVKMLAGEKHLAVSILDEAHQRLVDIGDSNPIIAAMLSQGMYAIGDFEGARRHAEEACTASLNDVMSARHLARGVLAKLLAREGEGAEAEKMARGVVAHFESTELLIDHGMALEELAEVLELSGRSAEAADRLGDAIDLFERKGDIVSAARAGRTRERLG